MTARRNWASTIETCSAATNPSSEAADKRSTSVVVRACGTVIVIAFMRESPSVEARPLLLLPPTPVLPRPRRPRDGFDQDSENPRAHTCAAGTGDRGAALHRSI